MQAAIGAFNFFMNISSNAVVTNATTAMQTPFNPSARLAVVTSWQANDPLVHYHAIDLMMSPTNQNRQYLNPGQPSSNIWPASLQHLNPRYSPWGGNPNNDPLDPVPGSYDRTIKDPGMY